MTTEAATIRRLRHVALQLAKAQTTQRRAIQMAHRGGLSVRQISEAVDMPPSSVHRIIRAQ